MAASPFRVATIQEGLCNLSAYNRRDFFKISLVVKGCSELLWAQKGIVIDKPALVFTNPSVPYAWEGSVMEQDYEGCFCVFSEEFVQGGGRLESLKESLLFKPSGRPVFFLNDEQVTWLSSLFARMRQEVDGDYIYKQEVLRSHVELIIHEAIKMEPAVAYFTPPNAAARITKLFLGLLEKQFPVDRTRYTLQLKKASDYAAQLSVHVNHLNAAVQETSGQSTTAHINERIIAEARSLLRHTDWTVAEIGYSLGFEYASYFNNFFKKHSGLTPMAVRNSA